MRLKQPRHREVAVAEHVQKLGKTLRSVGLGA
jgi:hypothetical protein